MTKNKTLRETNFCTIRERHEKAFSILELQKPTKTKKARDFLIHKTAFV